MMSMDRGVGSVPLMQGFSHSWGQASTGRSAKVETVRRGPPCWTPVTGCQEMLLNFDDSPKLARTLQRFSPR